MTFVVEGKIEGSSFHCCTTISSYKHFPNGLDWKAQHSESGKQWKELVGRTADAQYTASTGSLGAVFDGTTLLLNVDHQVFVSRIVRSLYDVLQLTDGKQRTDKGAQKFSKSVQPKI